MAPPMDVPNEREMMKYSPPPSTRRLVEISAMANAVGMVTRWPMTTIRMVPPARCSPPRTQSAGRGWHPESCSGWPGRQAQCRSCGPEGLPSSSIQPMGCWPSYCPALCGCSAGAYTPSTADRGSGTSARLARASRSASETSSTTPFSDFLESWPAARPAFSNVLRKARWDLAGPNDRKAPPGKYRALRAHRAWRDRPFGRYRPPA